VVEERLVNNLVFVAFHKFTFGDFWTLKDSLVARDTLFGVDHLQDERSSFAEHPDVNIFSPSSMKDNLVSTEHVMLDVLGNVLLNRPLSHGFTVYLPRSLGKLTGQFNIATIQEDVFKGTSSSQFNRRTRAYILNLLSLEYSQSV